MSAHAEGALAPRGAALSESRWLRLFTFGALYFAQGVPWGFIAKAYVVFLTDLGFSNESIGAAMGIAYAPWSFKVLWGPLIDRFPSARLGRRRPYIIGAEFMMGATMFALLFINPVKAVSLISSVLFLHNTFAALQDVAVDALAVDILPEDERGRANSVMWASKLAGVGVGGSLGLIIGKHLGWPTLFVGIALCIWAIMALVIAVRERPAGAALEAADISRLTVREVLRSFSFKAPLLGIAIAMLTPAGYALVGAVSTRMLRAELKLSEEAIATLGFISPFVSVGGALIGGPLADKIGPRKTMGGFMIAIGITLAAFAALPRLWPSFSFLVGWNVALDLFTAAYSAASFGFFMTLSNPAIGATQFAVYMASTNLTYSWTSWLGGVTADRFGLLGVFAIAAVVQIVTIAILPFCDPKEAEARFRPSKRDEADAPVAIPNEESEAQSV